MALSKEIETQFGVKANYHSILNYTVNRFHSVINFMLDSFVDADARTAGSPIVSEPYCLAGEDFSAIDMNSPIVPQLYAFIKTKEKFSGAVDI